MKYSDLKVGMDIVCVNAKNNPWGTLTEGKVYQVEALHPFDIALEPAGVVCDDGTEYWYSLDRFDIVPNGTGWDSP